MLIKYTTFASGKASSLRSLFRLMTTSIGHDNAKCINSMNSIPNNGFTKINESIVYAGKYRKIIQKKIKYPNGKLIDFEVLTQGCSSVTVFVWDRNTSTTTLVVSIVISLIRTLNYT